MGREATSTELVVAARISNVLILVIALAVMANLESIQTAWFLSLLFGAGMGAVLVLRWLWERINLWSEIAAIVTSLITAPLLLWFLGTGKDLEWVRLGTMALTTTVAAVGITFVTPATDEDVLRRFYERVRPLGFWRKTARAFGHSPTAPRRALARRLWAMTLTALSLFFLLIGLGRLLIPPPGASLIWTWGCVLVGLVLIPFWWRDALLRDDLLVARTEEDAERDRDEKSAA